MKVKVTAAVLACKAVRSCLRIFKRGGTALPGKIALSICPDLLRHLAVGVQTAAVTGTNGKTTSARMLEQVFIEAGADCFANKSGSNLMRGIAAEFALNASLSGKPKRAYAVIECDEAAARQVFGYLKPKAVLVTNLFQDQLDRFGDIDAALDGIKAGLRDAPRAVICLNADDALVSSLTAELPNRAVFFGMNAGGSGDMPDVLVEEILQSNADSQEIRISAFGKTIDTAVNLPGVYNALNAAGAVAAASAMGFGAETACGAMRNFERGFGRMELFELNGLSVRMILVKNAAGCNEAIRYLSGLEGGALVALSLNDRVADGTDISWIWDAEFEKLLDTRLDLRGVLVSGSRADEMALRLKYAGFEAAGVRVFRDEGGMLKAALGQDAPVYIIPTYSAMMEIRARICRDFGLQAFWE